MEKCNYWHLVCIEAKIFCTPLQLMYSPKQFVSSSLVYSWPFVVVKTWSRQSTLEFFKFSVTVPNGPSKRKCIFSLKVRFSELLTMIIIFAGQTWKYYCSAYLQLILLILKECSWEYFIHVRQNIMWKLICLWCIYSILICTAHE